MKIIVTGGAGFVGSHLVEHLISKKYFPIIVDNLASGKYDNIKKFVDAGKAKFFKIDIRNFKDLLKLPATSTIIHLAAVASVVESITNPIYVNDVNVNGTLNMLEFARKRNIKKFIFASSAAVYGDYKKLMSESVLTIPTSVYGSTKLTGEQYCKIYSKLFGINVVAFRPFNIYGPRQNDAYSGVISKFMTRLMSNKPPIIFGHGKQTRDFIHVEDIARAFASAISYKSSFDVFNLATGKTVSVNELARIMLTAANKTKLKPIHKKAIPGVVVYSSADTRKIKKSLRFEPSVDLHDGITALVKA